MDTRTGQIHNQAEIDKLDKLTRQYIRPMKLDPTPEQQARGKVGRNDPCPCGSGKKFKKCCLDRS